MKVNLIRTNQNINFKANFFKVEKYGQASAIYVCTDNSEKLGSKPIIETDTCCAPMVYDGKYYTSEYSIRENKYKIRYEDTGKYENQGFEKSFDQEKLLNLSNSQNESQYFILSKGAVQGRLVQAKNIDVSHLKSKEPLIIICDNDEECYKYRNYASGIIMKSGSADLLSHFAAICRDYFSFGMYITDKKILNDLSNLEGKLIYISNKNKNLEYFPIDNIVKNFRRKNTIEVPSMRRVDKILSLEECEKDTVGNKAYNLKRMMDLVKEGKLKNVIIPNAFVLPYAYLEKIENLFVENNDDFEQENKIIQEIRNYAKNVITQPEVMIRSAFNGEDLEDYSAAGLYNSYWQDIEDFNLDAIYSVIESKNKPIAVSSRKQHNILDEAIKPSVILQDRIKSDYSFTTYTESPLDKNKVLIEMFITEVRCYKPKPYQITYNKLTKELKVEQEHSKYEEYLYDENYNLIDKKATQPKDVKKVWDVVKDLVRNALVLEKEFGKPQDIEGGIKDGQLYFWQTRNIVHKI